MSGDFLVELLRQVFLRKTQKFWIQTKDVPAVKAPKPADRPADKAPNPADRPADKAPNPADRPADKTQNRLQKACS